MTTQHSCRVSDEVSMRSGAGQMGARGEDPEPYRPTANSSSSSSGQRAQDAVILERERLRQAVERCGKPETESRELQEMKVDVDLETQSISIQQQPDLHQ